MTDKTPPAYLLDLTRTMRRTGRVPTGIDRVERAYLDHLLANGLETYGIVRTQIGYLLIGPEGLREFHARLAGQKEWGPRHPLDVFPGRRSLSERQAEADLRRLRLSRATPRLLRRMLRHHLPKGVEYLNVGHSNLTDRMIDALRSVPEAKISVMIHDAIPLTHPDYQRAGTAAPFRAMLHRVHRCADRVIYPSEYSRGQVESLMAEWGSPPPALVAPLGVNQPVPNPVKLPEGLPPKGPFFLAVGSIEPRKNIPYLLDLWQEMGQEAPGLVICGPRGWESAETFARLDGLPKQGPISVWHDLPDEALWALMNSANALLFPSHVEGFGLPVVEAATLNVPVLCQDLSVIRETLQDIPIYAPTSDRYLWKSEIMRMASEPSKPRKNTGFSRPTWTDHFNRVLRLT